MAALTKTEKSDLVRLEAVIAAGVQTFVDVGHALLQIRDRELYKAEHASFEAYCKARWGFTRRHGDRLIAAAEVAENLGPDGPQNEAQARPLTNLPPEKQREVWDQAKGKPTGENIREVLARMSDADQLAAIDREEQEALRSPPPPATPRASAGGRDRIKQIESTVARLRRIHAGLVDVADEADRLLDKYVAKIHESGEE